MTARLCRDREAAGNRQIELRHLCEPETLATEQRTTAAARLVEVVDVLHESAPFSSTTGAPDAQRARNASQSRSTDAWISATKCAFSGRSRCANRFCTLEPVLDRLDRLGRRGSVDRCRRRPRRAARSTSRPPRASSCGDWRGSWPQPSGQSVSTFRNAGPSAAAARSTFVLRSCQCVAAACAT